MTLAFVSIIRDSWGGSEELWASCAEQALSQGHRVVISAYDCGRVSGKMQRVIDKGAILEKRIGTISNDLSVFNYAKKRIRRVFTRIFGNPFHRLYKYNPDILLYIGTGYSIANDYKLLDLIIKKKVAFFINVQLNSEFNQDLPQKKKIIRCAAAYQLCKKVFFVSQRNKQVVENTIKTKLNNGIVVRNPVNISCTSIVPYPNNSKIQMAMVGNLRVVHKGQDIVLQALSGSEWRQRNWHLNIYGSGEDESYLRDTVDHLKLNDKVTFHGKVNDIRGVWEVNNILLMPSHMEGMPLAVVEAMLCGRICVGTDVGGISEWIDHGKNGFIADAPTVSSIMRTMEDAWIRLQDWEKMGIDAHQRAMQLYDPEPGKTLLKLITESII